MTKPKPKSERKETIRMTKMRTDDPRIVTFGNYELADLKPEILNGPRDVTFENIKTAELKPEILNNDPLLWLNPDGEGDAATARAQSFALEIGLTIARRAGENGGFFEIPVFDVDMNAYRVVDAIAQWTERPKLPASPFAVLFNAYIDTGSWTLLTCVDDHFTNDPETFHFQIALAFRTPEGKLGWMTPAFGKVGRENGRMYFQDNGGTNVEYTGFYVSLLFQFFDLAAEGKIAPSFLINPASLN